MPKCLPAAARIATPTGDVAVGELREGMSVYTRGASGERIVTPILIVGRTPVTAPHAMVHVKLSDGRSVAASPLHPIADGHALESLHAGERYDGAIVESATREPYTGEATYDLLPDGPTGIYWVDGVALKSTLAPR